jgi:hypothetical protein
MDKISDVQGVLKDFTIISALYMKILIFRSKLALIFFSGESEIASTLQKNEKKKSNNESKNPSVPF